MSMATKNSTIKTGISQTKMALPVEILCATLMHMVKG